VAQIGRLIAGRCDQRDAARVGVVHRARRGLDDRPLLGLLLGRVGRVARAVEQPRVDVERHVDHVDADVARVGQGVHRRLQQEEP